MNNYSAYWQAQQKRLGITVLQPKTVLKQHETAVQITQKDGSQFPRIIEQPNTEQ